ncbi:hypothetical protein AB0D99_18855 [Streptomyces sp. NPDC047971]|uniref:hypothetical protein n=1 Tax=Streptomyces sp. NPDC047971 TaxID=3154499 RepID=UPI0033C8637A
MRPLATRASVLLLSAALLTACSSSDSGGGDAKSEPEIGAVPKLLRTAELSYPMDTYETTPEQLQQLQKAQNRLISQCMQRFGFTYEPPPPVQSGRGSGSDDTRYGLTDPDKAARYGYDSRAGAAPPVKPPAPSLGATGQLALSGPDLKQGAAQPMSWEEAQKADSGKTVNGQKVPIGGCNRESYLKLYAPKKGAVDVMFVFNVTADAFTRARDDSRVAEAITAWSACMAEKGYKADDPVSPQEDLGIASGALGSPKAVAAAKQDVACKERANLVGVWFTVESAYQQRNVEQNAETLNQAKTELEERLKLANTLNG